MGAGSLAGTRPHAQEPLGSGTDGARRVARALSRPARYHGFATQPGCNPALWTDRRYADEVVASLAAALGRLAGREQPLVLIGYSGGGTLAMLLAPRLPTVVAVVTVAANLDIATWAELHHYRPLVGSLNPADQRPLDPRILQLHFAGELDYRVPPQLIQAALIRLHAPARNSCPTMITATAGGVAGRPDLLRFATNFVENDSMQY